MTDKYLIEEDRDLADFVDDLEEVDDEGPEEDEEIVADDLDTEEESPVNEMSRKTIQFPILIEGFDEDDQPVSINIEDATDYAQEYGDFVVENVEQNKKFIISALDVYDFEFYYDSYDQNSNVKFVIACSEDLNNSSMMNVLKRYFNITVENKVTDEGEFNLTPVLDNKFIKIS